MSEFDKEWQQQAIALDSTGTVSWRDISNMLSIPKSTVSDFLRSYYSALGEGNKGPEGPITHGVIFDTQVRPEIDLDYLRWIGEYFVHKRPDIWIHVGDHGDMPSLSSYDKGKRKAELKRVKADFEASYAGMVALLSPLWKLQEEQRAAGEKVYNPRRVFLYGNHEARVETYVNNNPEMHGFISLDNFRYEELGWETVPFLTPIKIDGINYCHYFPNVMTGKPLGGSAANMIKTIGESFTMGHRQLLDVTTRTLQASGDRQWGVICGASYVHDEEYKGEQGNKHWRGVLIKHNVKNGDYDPMFVNMEYLRKEYA